MVCDKKGKEDEHMNWNYHFAKKTTTTNDYAMEEEGEEDYAAYYKFN